MSQRIKQKTGSRRGRYVGGTWMTEGSIEDDHWKIITQQCEDEAADKMMRADLLKWMTDPMLTPELRNVAMRAYGVIDAVRVFREVWCRDPSVMLSLMENVI